ETSETSTPTPTAPLRSAPDIWRSGRARRERWAFELHARQRRGAPARFDDSSAFASRAMPRGVFRRHPYAALAERPLVRPLIPASGAALVLLSSLPSFAQARASAEPIRLEWIRLEGAESCPARPAFERALSNKLGGSPFSHGAPRTLTIELS